MITATKITIERDRLLGIESSSYCTQYTVLKLPKKIVYLLHNLWAHKKSSLFNFYLGGARAKNTFGGWAYGRWAGATRIFCARCISLLFSLKNLRFYGRKYDILWLTNHQTYRTSNVTLPAQHQSINHLIHPSSVDTLEHIDHRFLKYTERGRRRRRRVIYSTDPRENTNLA